MPTFEKPPNPFVEAIKATLPWLFDELGYRPTWYVEKCVELDSETMPFRLRVGRSFGTSLRLAPTQEPERWIGIDALLKAIRGEAPIPRLIEWTDLKAFPHPTLEGQGALLRDNLDVVIEVMGSKLADTRLALARYGELWKAAEAARAAEIEAHPEIVRRNLRQAEHEIAANPERREQFRRMRDRLRPRPPFHPLLILAAFLVALWLLFR